MGSTHVLLFSQIWGQFAIRGVNSCFALLAGGVGWVQVCKLLQPRLGGKRWLEPKRPTPQPADQATRYLAQIYWPPPCALPNLNNFAKAHKAFCRFWCLGLQDANIGVLQFRREGGALGPRTLRLGGCAAKKEDNKHPPTQNSKFCEPQTNKMEESHNSETICQDARKSLNSKQP